MEKPVLKNGDVPLFTSGSFFRPNENVYIQLSTEFPEYVGVMHKHTFIEIVYILSGNATHHVGKHSYPVVKGDLCIVNYETPHAFMAQEDAGDRFIAYDLMFTPNFLDAKLMLSSSFESISSSYLFYSLFPEQQPYQPDLQLRSSRFNDIGAIFDRIFREYHTREQGFIDIIRAYIIELIVMILRLLNAAQDECAPQHKSIVDSVLLHMRDHFDKHITIEELARNVFLSKNYFARLFRETTGTSVNAFLQAIRIDEACKMLSSTELTVNDVANQCGYKDMKNFYNAFKKRMKMTPGEYRGSVR